MMPRLVLADQHWHRGDLDHTSWNPSALSRSRPITAANQQQDNSSTVFGAHSG